MQNEIEIEPSLWNRHCHVHCITFIKLQCDFNRPLCICRCSLLISPWWISSGGVSECVTCLCLCVCPVLQKAYCGHCSERIWGLGRQGYKCINCKLLVHKRCHRLIPQTCQRLMVSISSRGQQLEARCQPATPTHTHWKQAYSTCCRQEGTRFDSLSRTENVVTARLTYLYGTSSFLFMSVYLAFILDSSLLVIEHEKWIRSTSMSGLFPVFINKSSPSLILHDIIS